MKKYLFVLSIVFASCITEYNFQQEIAQDALVIEGYITDKSNESKIILTQSQPFDKARETWYVEDALVQVIQDDYLQHTFVFHDNAYYPVDTSFKAQLASRYKLKIQLTNGEVYESEEVTLMKSAEIDKLKWESKSLYHSGGEKDQVLQFMLTTIPDETASQYYRYTFNETWLYVAPLSNNKVYKLRFITDNKGRVYDFEYEKTDYDNTTYCWPSKKSSGIALASSQGLSQNVLIDYPVFNLDLTKNGDRLLYKYSLLVKQFSIHEKVHHILSVMKEFSENDAALFSTQPGFVEGNIKNITNPSKKAIGVFYASELKEFRTFITIDELKQEDRNLVYRLSSRCIPTTFTIPSGYCPLDPSIKSLRDSVLTGLSVADIKEEEGSIVLNMSYYHCIDCRVAGTNIKPSWWGDLFY